MMPNTRRSPHNTKEHIKITMGKSTSAITFLMVVCLTMVEVTTITALSSSSSSSLLLSGGRTTKRHQQHLGSRRFDHEKAIEQRRRRRLRNTRLCHSLQQRRPPTATTTAMLSAAYDIQVTSPSYHHHYHELEQRRNDYYRASAIGNDLDEVQVLNGGGEFFGDRGSSATLLAFFEENEDVANCKDCESTTIATPWSVASYASTAVAAVAVAEDDSAQTSKVADIVNSIQTVEGGTLTIIGETVATSPPSSSSSSTSGVAKTTVIGDDEKAQGVMTEEATTAKATTTTIDTTIATKVDHSIVKENANGVINTVGGDKPDIVMEKEEKVVNDFISSEIAKDAQRRNDDNVRFNIDRDTEMKEMEERKVRMRRLADDRLAADIAESKLREEREALDKLVAIRDARQSTIDALRSAIDKAMREQMKMGKDESLRRTELETILEDAERARILSVEKERMLRLDMKLARVEAIALEERIETIRDSMHKLEVEQEGTRSMLEEKMKTITAIMPPTKATTSKISSPSVSRSSKSNVKSISSDDRVVKKPSPTSTSSSSMLDIPDKLSIIAGGALVLGTGVGAVLFMNTPKDEKEVDGGASNAAKKDSSSSSILASPIVSVSREDRYSRTIFDRSSSTSSSDKGTQRGKEQKQGSAGDKFGREQVVTSFGEVRSFSTFRSKPIADGYDTTAKSDAFSGLGKTIGPPFGGNNSAGGKTTSIVTSVGGTGSGFTPSSSSFIGKTSTSPPGFGGVGQRSTSSVGVGAGIGERSGGGSMPIAKGKESNGGGVSPPFSSGTGSGFGGSGMKESTNKMASSSQFSGSGFGGGGMMKNRSSGFAAGSTGMPVKGMSASVLSNNIGVGAGFGERSGGMPTIKGTESSGLSPLFSSSTGSGSGGMMKESTNSGSGFGGGGMMKTQSSGFTAGASGIPVKGMSKSDSSSLFGKGSPNSKSVGSGFTSKMINQPATVSAFVKQSYTSQLTSGTTANDNVNSFEGINKGSTGFSSSPQSPMSGGPSSLNGISKGVPGVGSSSSFLKSGVKSSTTALESKVSSPPGFGGISKGVAGFGTSSSGSLGTMKGEQNLKFGGSPFGSDKSSSASIETKSSPPTGLSGVDKGVPAFGGGAKSSATTLDAKVLSPSNFGGASKGVPGFGVSSSGSLGTMKGEQKSAFGGSSFGGDKSSFTSVGTKSSSPTGFSGVNKGVSGFGGGLDSKVSSPPSFSGVSKGVAGFGASPLKSLGNMKGEQNSAFGGSPFGGDKSSSISKGGVKSSFAPLNSKITSPSGFGGVSKGVQGFATSSSGLLDAIKGEQTSAFGGSSSGGGVKSSFTSVETKLSSPTPPGFGEISKGVTGFGTSSSGSLGTMKGEQKSVFGGFPFGSDNSRSTSAKTKSSSPTPPGFGGVSKGVPSFGKSSSGSAPMKGEQKSVFGASPSTSFGGFGGETSSKSEGFSKGGIQSMPKSFGSDKLGSGFSNKASSLSGGIGANKSKFATMDMKSSSSSSYPGFGGGSSLQSDSAGPSSATPNIMKGKQASLDSSSPSFGGSSSPSFGTGGGMKNMPSLKMVPTPPAFDLDGSSTNNRDLFKSSATFGIDPRASSINNSRGIPPQSSNTTGRGGAMSGRGGPGKGGPGKGGPDRGGPGRGSVGRPGPPIDTKLDGSMLKGSQGRKQLQGYGAVPGTSIDSQMLGAFGSFGSKRSSSSSFRQPGSGYSKESLTAYQESMSTFRDMSSFREGSTPSPSPLLGNSDDDLTNQIGESTDSMRRFRSGEIQA